MLLFSVEVTKQEMKKPTVWGKARFFYQFFVQFVKLKYVTKLPHQLVLKLRYKCNASTCDIYMNIYIFAFW